MVATVLKGTNRQKYHVTLCGLSPGNADVTSLQGLADEIHVLGMRNFFDLSVIVPLYTLLKRSKVDVLHTHRIRPDIVGRIVGTLARIPVNISTQHYVEEWSERGTIVHRIVRALFKWTMGLCQSVACISAAEQDTLLQEIGEQHRSKTCVVHNGLDTDYFQRPPQAELAALRKALALPPRARVVTVVAYLTERKGHQYLLEAIAQLRQAFPDIVLLIVGDGPQESELVHQAEGLGITEYTRFLGNRKEIPGMLSLSEVAVLPSLWEPFGLAALEAMAVETPVVVTRTGGLPEFVTQDESGYLVPPADAQALAESITQLLANPAMSLQMGIAARNTVMQRFTARHVALAYERLYEQYLADITPPAQKRS